MPWPDIISWAHGPTGWWLLMAHSCLHPLRIVLGSTGAASSGKLCPLLPRSSLLVMAGDVREPKDIFLPTKWDHLSSAFPSPDLLWHWAASGLQQSSLSCFVLSCSLSYILTLQPSL